jgi:hypothetical protein
MDPFTAMAAATAAYNGIKKSVQLGRELTDMTKSITTWSKAVSDLNFLEDKAKKPPMYKMFTDTQSDAIEIWAQKKKLQEMREELRSFISWNYGPKAWEEILKIEADQRKEQRDLVYAKQEFIDNCINWTVGVAAAFSGLGILFVVMYIIGANQGKW